MGACEVGLGDCDDDLGCEAAIDEVTRCGDCDTVCIVANGEPACVDNGEGGFECAIAECAEGFKDCNGDVRDGCEVNTLLDVNHCGSCETDCENAGPVSNNADFACAGGSCLFTRCETGFGDCDNNASNGCEVTHRTAEAQNDCRFCGDDCDQNADSAFTQCTPSGCQVGDCRDGFADCNGRASDACEVNLKDAACDAAVAFAGEEVAESTCGVFCGVTTGETLFESTTAFGSKWFQARAKEAPGLCNDDLTHRIELLVPPGHDYDIFVYSDCGATLMGSARTRGDDDEVFVIRVPDGSAQDRSFNYWVEVRWVEGDTCSPYTINFYGRTSC